MEVTERWKCEALKHNNEVDIKLSLQYPNSNEQLWTWT
jgi:hypothetical protein